MNVVLHQERYHQKCNNIQDFDHRVDGRTCGILVRIANRIARHRRLMSVRTLQMLLAILIDETVLERFLGVIPSAAA